MPKDLDERTRKVLCAYPMRNPVKWRMENGKAVLIYKKNLGKVEKRILSVVGGPENIRRPLDDKGSDIWLMCDGDHSIMDICVEMDKKYKEEMEPVVKRVGTFIEMLLKLNLVTLRGEPEETKRDNDQGG